MEKQKVDSLNVRSARGPNDAQANRQYFFKTCVSRQGTQRCPDGSWLCSRLLGPAAKAGVVDDLGAAFEVEFLHGVGFVGFDGLDADG
jgi:hypothetical protein